MQIELFVCFACPVKFFEKDSIAYLTGALFLALLNAFVVLFNRGAAIPIVNRK